MAVTKLDKLLIVIAVTIAITASVCTLPAVYANTPPQTITPTNLVAVAASPTQINLSWIPPTQNYGKIITGFKVEESLGYGVYSTLVFNTQSTIPTYFVTGLKTGTTYGFRVSAVYSDDTSTDPSNPASATPLVTSALPLSNSTAPSTNIEFDFTPSDGTTMSGVILTQTDYQQLQDRKDSRSIMENIAHTGQPINNNLNSVLIYQSDHQSSPAIPGPLIAHAVSPTQINLFWMTPKEIYSQSIIGYKIEWKQAAGDYVAIEDNTQNVTTKYSVVGLTTGTTYTYRVLAIYFDETMSNPSNEASATPLSSLQPASIPTQSNASQSTSTGSRGQSVTQTPAPPANVQFDFTTSDGVTLSNVILTQNDYQQLIVIKDPRSIISNITQTSNTINNDLGGLIRYQNIHTPQFSSENQVPNNTSSISTSSTSNPLDIRVVEGVITSVVATGVVGIVTWLVRTKLAKKISKDYYFTLERFSENGVDNVRIRNSGQTIEDCTITCESDLCFWIDTNMDKPRHVFEGSVLSIRLPKRYENTNPLIIVKSGKKTLRKIKLDDMAHG